MDKTELSQIVVDMAKNLEACLLGIATTDTLAGGPPPSTDLTYALQGARSAICLAVPLDQEKIEQSFESSAEVYIKRPMKDHPYFNSVKPGFRTEYICSHCQLICHPNKEGRRRRYRMVVGSGGIVQNPDGSRKLAGMSPDEKWLYEPLELY